MNINFDQDAISSDFYELGLRVSVDVKFTQSTPLLKIKFNNEEDITLYRLVGKVKENSFIEFDI